VNTKYLTITRPRNSQRVPGVLAVAALAGTVLQLSGAGSTVPSAHTDALAMKKGDNTEGKIYFNFREVIAGTTQPLANLVFGNSDVNPVLVDQPVDLIEADEIEAEGGDTAADGKADYLITDSGDTNHYLVGTETVGQRLTVIGGKWGRHYAAATEAIYGRLIQWLTPSDTGNLRALIEVYSEARFDKVV
jgi:hypothetical protein